jgi:hypothetical protein
MDKVPNDFQGSSITLRDAAAVLKLEAKSLRKERYWSDAEVVNEYANKLLAVANGKTWAEAMGWDAAREKP